MDSQVVEIQKNANFYVHIDPICIIDRSVISFLIKTTITTTILHKNMLSASEVAF